MEYNYFYKDLFILNFMGLRQYFNDFEFSKRVNYSRYGKYFENSDFAKSAELTSILVGLAMKEKGLDYKAMGIAGTLFFPLAHLSAYIFVKKEKKKDPLFYTHFLDDFHFILND